MAAPERLQRNLSSTEVGPASHTHPQRALTPLDCVTGM